MSGTIRNLFRRSGVLAAAATGLVAAQAPQAAGPPVDRVGLPAYGQNFTLLRRFHAAGRSRVGLVYANPPAAAVTELGSLPYPYGSILVVEWRPALTDASGAPLRDAAGAMRAGDQVVQIDVMRRERGYGAAYGAARTGEWEFASYGPDGSHATVPADTGQCAACHQTAGEARDFVFRGRFPPASDARMMGN
jgi:hypothetical protein